MGSYAGQRLQTSGVCGWVRFALVGLIVSVFFQGALCDIEPTESQCRPYIEKALKEQHTEAEEKAFEKAVVSELNSEQEEFSPTDELTDSTEGSITKDEENDDGDDNEDDAEIQRKDEGERDDGENANAEEKSTDNNSVEEEDIKAEEQDDGDDDEGDDDGRGDEDEKDESPGNDAAKTEEDEVKIDDEDDDQKEEDKETIERLQAEPLEENDSDVETKADEKETAAADADDESDDFNLERRIEIEVQDVEMDNDDDDEDDAKYAKEDGDDKDAKEDEDDKDAKEDDDDDKDAKEDEDDKDDKKEQTGEGDQKSDEEREQEKDYGPVKSEDANDANIGEDEQDLKDIDDDENKASDTEKEEAERAEGSDEDEKDQDDTGNKDSDEHVKEKIEKTDAKKIEAEEAAEKEEAEEDNDEAPEEEELTKEMVIPENLRPRNHIDKILRLEDSEKETVLEKTIDATLKALKTLYDSAIKPLEILYKYRDLSNRHFGDPEIFSKPLILFMGPWSGGKSSTINYLLDNEFSQTSLRTGAEPSPAYFNILMHGEEEEVLDGTQLAADWTFSGLQKFGQSLLDRLKGIKMPNKLLEKVNIVEIPGILEIRKQVQRLFPFNDACQWFIDRADIIFLVYDPSKLDVGPETEAILDQLKGREYQTRIILNKADQVKPEELMRVQGTLIWNISPLMSSSEPPIMYSTSLWSLPYEVGAPTRLLQAQERAFLKDLREAIDKRVENKIASARRFAVRVRNHAKMVDCYLTTYYNHKTIFGNRKRISDDIIEYPQKYHIYEGLSTLTNISRYDLPDPDVYRDFFKINPLYEFKKLSETCTYFRGCPINKLDVAIAYDLPELVGKYKKSVETVKEQLPRENS